MAAKNLSLCHLSFCFGWICTFALQANTKVSPGTIIPSVRILALEVQFEVCNDVKMMPCFLKCFPNVETLPCLCKVSQPVFVSFSILHYHEAPLLSFLRWRVDKGHKTEENNQLTTGTEELQ
jgi:hypothetical protein